MTRPSEERKIARRLDAAAAMVEYRAEQSHIASNMARLKALRLAQAEQQAENPVAVNKPVGDNTRKGAVKQRSQLETPVMGEKKWTKRRRKVSAVDSSWTNGQFMDQRGVGKFKGVRREKTA